MVNDVLGRSLDVLVKAVVGLVVARGGYQAFEGSWFGQVIFDSYRREHGLALLSPPALSQVYREWGSGSVSVPLAELSAVKLLLAVLVLLGLAAHIVYKPSITQAGERARRPSRLLSAYCRCYHVLTVVMFALLLCLFLLWPAKFALVVLALLIVAPGTLYLLLYSRDLLQGNYLDRLAYICLLFVVAATLICWPYLYGHRVFQPEFYVVHLAGAEPDHCDPSRLHRGPVFLAWQEDGEKRKLFFRVCFEQDGDKLLDFFEYPGKHKVVGKESLSTVLADFVPPVPRADGSKAVRDTAKLLEELGQ